MVLVNRGGARPCEIISLGKYICAKVKEKFAVDLYPEVRFIGKDGEVFLARSVKLLNLVKHLSLAENHSLTKKECLELLRSARLKKSLRLFVLT